ncbi:hypothetical protein B4U79_15261, partial [Dinothrombium tinctorium]
MAKNKVEITVTYAMINLVVVSCLLSFLFKLLISESIASHPNSNLLRLTDFYSKLAFTFKYQTLAILSLFICIVNVITKRALNPSARNPLSGNEKYTEAAKNILQNTVEQYLLHLILQLILITYIDGSTVVKMIPLMSWSFFIGRLAFMIGYPLHREFGFLL